MGLPGFLEISQTILQENALSVGFSTDTTFSFPVLIQRYNALHDAMFLYNQAKEGQTLAKRPFGWVILLSSSGKVVHFSNCGVMDFMPQGSGSLDKEVSIELPPLPNPKQNRPSFQKFYEVYEQLRRFAFVPNLTSSQKKVIENFRQIFLALVPIGHYPYYKALSPEFFAWLGMFEEDTLPERLQRDALAQQASADKPNTQKKINPQNNVEDEKQAADLQREGYLSKLSESAQTIEFSQSHTLEALGQVVVQTERLEIAQRDVASMVARLVEMSEREDLTQEVILQAIDTLAGFVATTQERDRQILLAIGRVAEQFDEKIARDTHKEKLFDAIHAELSEYKNDLLNSLTFALESDIIKLVEDTKKTIQVFDGKNVSKENFKKLLSLFEGIETDLCDLLYRHGLEPYFVEGNRVEIVRQKILATIPTDNLALDKTTAARLARGWEKNGKIVRPERITVYLYTAPEDAKSEN